MSGRDGDGTLTAILETRGGESQASLRHRQLDMRCD